MGVFDALDAALKGALDLTFEVLTVPESLAMLARCEKLRRQLPAVEHPLINQLGEHADEAELGGRLGAVLAERLRITRAEANRRIGEAADLGPRRAMTGEPLEPVLAASAAAQRAGAIGGGHVAVIRRFYHRCPRRSTLIPPGTPRPSWPRTARSFAPMSWPCWPIGSPIV
ncbi:hypothetical protein [Microlunatus phosphovorus NM-1] [Mycobacterium shimoidei]|uniref:DUF222 domain-containing protein n=1 Tax=Mycobacterium shimoidei TaxID=29313 RepID=A0A375YYZ0_MYCSH|nr:hypothetical protein [Microlunatus phosphovorus NM-1] [Mycobacterium shimoidei]